MSNNLDMTRDFLEKNLRNLKTAFVLTKVESTKEYEDALDAQKELVLSSILESVNEHYTRLETAKANIKDPYIKKEILNGLAKVEIDKLLVFASKNWVLPETVELAISYGLMLDKASREDCLKAKMKPWEPVYRLVGTIRIDDDSVIKEGEIHA